MADKQQILIIEPDRVLRSELSATLQKEGYDIVAVNEVKAGLQMIQEINPGVIICEGEMPVIDGLTLCKIIKGDQSIGFSYFIVVTNKDEIKDKIAGLATEADDYLVKPFLPEELIARVRVGMRTGNLERELQNKEKEIRKIDGIQKWDLAIASKVQKSILHQDYPKNCGLKFSARYLACATLNGDMFDYFTLPDGKVGVFVADVSGHGASASLITILFRTLFHSLASEETSPVKALKIVNQALLSPLEDLASFVTIAYAIFDPKTKKLVYSTAAHPPLMMIRKDGQIDYLEAKGMMLGMFADYWCEEAEVCLERGERVLFYTDGIIEQKNSQNEQFDFQRVKNAVLENRHKSPKEVVDHIIASLWQFAEGAAIEDDYSVIMIEVE